jgi:3D (Asp-Asp-Asp) domain-containing protein
MYGFPDNDPPFSAIIAHPVVHRHAGGIGTFDNPITFASDPRVVPFGTKIYVPYLQKYFIMEDICAEAVHQPGVSHVDLWAGGNASTDVAALLAVEDADTRNAATIVINANPGHPVNVTPFAPGAPIPENVGTNGNDVLIAGPGNALLDGRGGNDLLRAGSGNDTLIGGPGHNTLIGGRGHDQFVFNAPLNGTTNVSVIVGFTHDVDRIDLSHHIFAAVNLSGPLSPAMFSEGAHAHTRSARIIYNPADGWLTYDSNGSAPGGETHFATLAPHLSLSSADFLVLG